MENAIPDAPWIVESWWTGPDPDYQETPYERSCPESFLDGADEEYGYRILGWILDTDSDDVEDPFPGLVSGGPSARVYDEPAKAAIPEGTAPMRCHLDDVGSFSTNEIAIYWNSITALVFAYFA